MVNSCCPGKDSATPAVPTTTTTCPGVGTVRNVICLPSSCQSRTWQLVTCQENHQLPGRPLKGCDPPSGQAPHLPEMSCVGFVCQPICPTVCRESGAAHPPRLVPSPPPPCSDSSGRETTCCDASSSQQSSCQEPVHTPGPCQAACDRAACCDAESCQPSCSEATPCAETSCPPILSAAGLCQPPCCQGVSRQPTGGEDQPHSAMCCQSVCYVFEPCQCIPCIPVSCRPLTCAFTSRGPTWWVPSPCQACHCQPVSPASFVCRPVASRRPPCSEKSPRNPLSCGAAPSGRPACGEATSRGGGCQSPPCQPACCVTGSGKASPCGSGGFRPASPSLCLASTRSLTSRRPRCVPVKPTLCP